MLVAVDRAGVEPLPISPRLRAQIVYFITPPGSPGVPPLGENEYWIARTNVTKWLMEGVFYLLSPLDSSNVAEIDISDEQETMLGWLDKNHVQHVRVVE